MKLILPALTITIAFLFTSVLGIFFIPLLKKLKYGQTILDIGPKWHSSKQGTPTMGGIMFILGISFAILFSIGLSFVLSRNDIFLQLSSMITASYTMNGIRTTTVLAGFVMAVSYGFIGFFDDYIKVVKKQNLGLTARQKTLLQLLVAVAYLITLYMSGVTFTKIPFIGQVDVSGGIGLIYWPVALFFIYGFVNAVNLTDGIDGLCSSVTVMVSIFYMLFSSVFNFSALNIMACASAGGCGGFLVWNFKPAKVFMGDTGSLFLGGLVVAMAFASGYPVLLIFVGIIYLAEALSVVIQVSYYKKTRKRLFKMAPIHHHFEMCNWGENKIVLVFSAITVIGAVLASLILLLSM